MASIQLDRHSGKYRIRFRFQGIEFKRSIKTRNEREAETILRRVDDTIRLLERGRLELPSVADPADFILSDGKYSRSRSQKKTARLKGLFATYNDSVPEGAKEANTLKGEKVHQEHFLRLLGAQTVVSSITEETLQEYIAKRSKEESPRGGTISPDTIRKETTTFRLIWNWAERNEFVTRRTPTRGLQYPKRDEKPPFMTAKEIERIIKRGGLDDAQQNKLWECLFLTAQEVERLLDEVQKQDLQPFIYPMILMTAHTGARRSEIMRSQIDDFDVTAGTVQIREKKRSRKHNLSFRRVPMTARLQRDMETWFDQHPGGQFTIAPSLTVPRGNKVRDEYSGLTTDETTDHFNRAISKTSWNGKLKGFHALRHSFASNAAAAGVEQMMIDAWLGHQTEEMRNRYRHLYPNQQRTAIGKIFG